MSSSSYLSIMSRMSGEVARHAPDQGPYSMPHHVDHVIAHGSVAIILAFAILGRNSYPRTLIKDGSNRVHHFYGDTARELAANWV